MEVVRSDQKYTLEHKYISVLRKMQRRVAQGLRQCRAFRTSRRSISSADPEYRTNRNLRMNHPILHHFGREIADTEKPPLPKCIFSNPKLIVLEEIISQSEAEAILANLKWAVFQKNEISVQHPSRSTQTIEKYVFHLTNYISMIFACVVMLYSTRFRWNESTLQHILWNRIERDQVAFDVLAASTPPAMPIVESLYLDLSVLKVGGDLHAQPSQRATYIELRNERESRWTVLLNLQSDSWGQKSFFLENSMIFSTQPRVGDAILFHHDVTVESKYGGSQMHLEIEAPIVFSKKYCKAIGNSPCCWGGCPHLGREH
jgi:hypothetical protein